MTSISPLRDKLVQLEHDTFEAASQRGKEYSEAIIEANLAGEHYEEQAVARLALYPALVENCQRALAALESPAAQKVLTWTLHREALQTVLAQAEAIEKGAKG